MTVVGFFVYFLTSAIFAFIVDRVVPGRIPGGFIAATIVGFIGGVIAVKLGPPEPSIALHSRRCDSACGDGRFHHGFEFGSDGKQPKEISKESVTSQAVRTN